MNNPPNSNQDSPTSQSHSKVSDSFSRDEQPIQDLINDFKSLPFETLFPIKQWLQDQPWKMRWVQALLFFALFPLTLPYLLGAKITIQEAAWLLGIYFSFIWGYILWLIVKPGELKWRLILGVTTFTAIIGIFLVLGIQQLPFINLLYSATDWSFSPARLLGFIAGVGLVEETIKLLPVFWLAIKLKQIHTPRSAAFYAGLSGLAFGVSEAVAYSVSYTYQHVVGMVYNTSGSGDYVVLEFLRLISLPFLHCVFSGIAGYYLGLSLITQERQSALILLGLAIAATTHGLYNFFSGSWLSPIMAMITILMFIGYIRSAEEITQKITIPQEKPNCPIES